ncbi:2-octaprenyl-6-methoxyphenol hydroxylase [Nitrosospira sp. Nsp5]|uniref:2-octaprenyl-6-methoxyphenol hydroxylase n=1 Tax=Nitrosospira multiformis TaxID=1231 RepID=A0ABY0T6H4_9PROT|nr:MULTISPECIES: FAD-dependent monooxygenase [Nitrosospira]PTR07086.1 2-octaprenyl-6-methoxyphenol hydroxylase [Nitrosospira sp. Nsp5]SDQ33259.1 2-octaprenyl-6-methoxyphenol hydroxylase [Nitrosospira multiformis]
MTQEKTTLKHEYDLIIIGGGPVGMALALALRGGGVSVLLLEARGLPEKTEDSRPLALSHGSRLILERLGVWKPLPDVTPITTIHISNRGGFGRTVMTADDIGVPALGYVINHHDVFRSMHKALKKCDVDYLTGAQVTRLEASLESGQIEFQHDGVMKKATARLLVLADGGRLTAQIEGVTQHVHDYQQWAVVARIKSECSPKITGRGGSEFTRSPAQAGVAYERFTPDGPVALLPSGDSFALVWTVSPSAAQEILALDDAAFLVRLHDHFGDRLGKLVEAGKRSGFPLTLKYATPVTACRAALIGNAAQTLHPVAGQGFNLGLRDAWELADEVIAAPAETGVPAMLARYRHRRRMDSSTGRVFTDSLVKLFSNDDFVLGSMRGMGLSALDCLPQAKRFVARRMMFGARG